MTICMPIGKFKTKIDREGFFGRFSTEVDFNIIWISSGSYSIDVTKSKASEDNPDLHPETEFNFSLTPEWLKKSVELFPDAPGRSRMESYIPFYQAYEFDRCMIDGGSDTFFQAFKTLNDEKQIGIAISYYSHGLPCGSTTLNIEFEEFKKLKEYLDNPNGNGPEIVYSGVQFI